MKDSDVMLLFSELSFADKKQTILYYIQIHEQLNHREDKEVEPN